MSLNIKNEATHARVRELAKRWETSQVEAVDRAVKAQLVALEFDSGVDAVQRILADVRQYRQPGLNAARSADDLYDGDGLPK